MNVGFRMVGWLLMCLCAHCTTIPDFYYGTTVVDINTKLVNGSFLDLNALSRPVLACKTSVASTNLHMTHNTARVTAVSGRLGIPNGGDTLFIVAFENVTGADGGQYACHVNNVRTAVINLRGV